MTDEITTQLSDCTRCRILFPEEIASQIQEMVGGTREFESAGSAFPGYRFVEVQAGADRKISGSVSKYGVGANDMLILITSDKSSV